MTEKQEKMHDILQKRTFNSW